MEEILQFRQDFGLLEDPNFIFEEWLLTHGFCKMNVVEHEDIDERFNNRTHYATRLTPKPYPNETYLYLVVFSDYDDVEWLQSSTEFVSIRHFLGAYVRDVVSQESDELIHLLSCRCPKNKAFAEQLMLHIFDIFLPKNPEDSNRLI
jgi:hypothetical protein